MLLRLIIIFELLELEKKLKYCYISNRGYGTLLRFVDNI